MKQASIAKTVEVYEKLLLQGFKATFSHIELWLVAIFASTLATGSILSTTLQGLIQIRPATEWSLDSLRTTFESIPLLTTLIQNGVMLPAWHFLLLLLSFLTIAAIGIWLLVSTQQVLLQGAHRAIRRKKRINVLHLFKKADFRTNLKLLSVDILVLLASSLIATLAAFPLSFFMDPMAEGLWNILIFLAVFSVVLPLLFIVNTIGMFMLVNIVHFNDDIIRAYHRAMKTTSETWMAALELSAVVLLVNLVIIIGASLLGALWVFTTSPLFFSSTATGSPVIGSITGLFIFFVGFILYVVLMGGITTFNYIVWTAFIERAERYSLLPATETLFRLLPRLFSR